MNRASMRSPLVRRAIEAINQGNLDDFIALFAPVFPLSFYYEGNTATGTTTVAIW